MEQSALEYNTERNELIIPEYGRHIQKMVQEAMKIADRTERNNTCHGKYEPSPKRCT